MDRASATDPCDEITQQGSYPLPGREWSSASSERASERHEMGSPGIEPGTYRL